MLRDMAQGGQAARAWIQGWTRWAHGRLPPTTWREPSLPHFPIGKGAPNGTGHPQGDAVQNGESGRLNLAKPRADPCTHRGLCGRDEGPHPAAQGKAALPPRPILPHGPGSQAAFPPREPKLCARCYQRRKPQIQGLALFPVSFLTSLGGGGMMNY